MKKITVRVSDDIQEKFQSIVEAENSTITETLREMIYSFCDDVGCHG